MSRHTNIIQVVQHITRLHADIKQ